MRAELGRPDVLKSAIAEMLGSTQAKERIRAFVNDWSGVGRVSAADKDQKLFPDFEKVRPALLAEAQAFLARFATINGSHRDLLLGEVPRVAALDAHYAKGAPAPGQKRLGILGLGGFQSTYAGAALSSPTLRGMWMSERLFCRHIPVPPDVPPLEEAQKSPERPKTTRQVYEVHMKDPSCAGCHRWLDPLGFTLESFDAVGRYRTQENGVAVDTRGEIVDSDVDRSVRGYQELAQALAESAEVRMCFARGTYRYFFGAEPDESATPFIQTSATAFRSSQRIGDLLTGLLTESGLHSRRRY
jgi:hypothetical protein